MISLVLLLLVVLAVTSLDIYSHALTLQSSTGKKPTSGLIGTASSRQNGFRLLSLRSSDKNKNMMQDIVEIKGVAFSKITKKIKPFLPVIGFYVFMNLPIYGVGIFSSPGTSQGFGSMTNFQTITNRGTPSMTANEYLVAPEKVAPRARVVRAPEYDVSAEQLSTIVERVIMRAPRITKVAEDKETMRKQYVQRSLLFRFPDVITFQIIPRNPNSGPNSKTSSIAVHSYSIFGAGDLGVNADRVKGFLREINEEVAWQLSDLTI